MLWRRPNGFYRISAFKIALWKTLLPLQTWLQKQQKSVYNIWTYLMKSGLLEQSLNSWLTQKEKTGEKMVIKIIYSKSRVSHSRGVGWGHLQMFLKPLIEINAPHRVPPLKNEGPHHLKNKSPVEKWNLLPGNDS